MCVSGAALPAGAFGPAVPTVSQQLSGNAGGFSFGQTFALTSAVSGITNAFASFKQASAQKESLLFQAQVQRRNAEIIELQKTDERITSKKERDAIRRKIKSIQQGIAPSVAANNILLGGGSPLDILTSSEVIRTADLGTAKVNEAKRIFGLDIKKFNANAQASVLEGSASNISPLRNATTSLLSGGANSFLKFKTFQNSSIKGNTLSAALKGFT